MRFPRALMLLAAPVPASVDYDDGTIQSYLDEIYGPDVVVVQSALRDLPAS